MRRVFSKILFIIIAASLIFNLGGCSSLQKKFTRKKDKKIKPSIYYQVRKYDIKPSMELYEKHYVFWLNWHRKLIGELGKNFKSDIRSSQEVLGNLEDMWALMEDEKANELKPHIDDISKAKAIIDLHNMTKVNETRIRLILEREYRVVKRKFSPKVMAGYIRKDWRESSIEEPLPSETAAKE